MKTEKLIIISSPAGGGKNTIANLLLQDNKQIEETVSCTTRQPIRAGEKNGVNYYFITNDAFEEKIKNSEFIEWEKVHGLFYYGTLKTEISRIINKHRIPLLVIDVQGALNIKKLFPKTILFFIKPPSAKIMAARIKKRSSINANEIKTRIETAKKELKMAKYYNHIIKNPEGHPEKAALEISKILEEYLR